MEKEDKISCLCGVCEYNGRSWEGPAITDHVLKRRVICIKCRSTLNRDGSIDPPRD